MSSTPRRLGRIGHFRGLTPWIGIVYGFLYFPILVLIAYSFNGSRLALVWSEFSLRWYVKLLQNGDIRQAAANTLIVATSSTIIATSIAIAAALALTRGGDYRGKSLDFGLLGLPIVVPEIVTAIATLMFLSSIGLSLGLGNLIVAHSTFCIPFAFLPIRARLLAMDDTLEQAARDLYSSPWETFRYVTLPLLMPGVLAGATLAFVISLDDFIISVMIADAGSTTLPVYIYSMIRQGISPEVNAVSTVLFAISVGLVTLYSIASRARK